MGKTPAEPKKLYLVQAGAYSVKVNADDMLAKVKAEGIGDVFIKTEYRSDLYEELLIFNDLPIGVSILTISDGAMHRTVQGGAVYP